MTHTHGPWQRSGVRGHFDGCTGHGVGPDDEDYVVVVPYDDKYHNECIDNANLIAASPTMLDALEAVSNEAGQLDAHLKTSVPISFSTIIKVRDAIYKAGGRW